MGQNSAKPQIMFFPALPGGPGGIPDQAATAYAQGARTPGEMARQMAQNQILGFIFGAVILAIVFFVYWWMGKEVPIKKTVQKFRNIEPHDETPDKYPYSRDLR
jgi:hypothetical protein